MSARRGLALLVALAGLAGPACGDRELPPAGQVVVHVDTDAMVRESTSAPDGSLLSPMIDRARFEVSRNGAPVPNSTRDVTVDAQMFRDRRLSFGVVPPADTAGVTVRIRLFRADRVYGTEPEAGITLDTTIELPPVPSEGVVDVSVVMKTDDFGLRIGQPAPIQPTRGVFAKSLAGTWRGGRRVGCAEGAQAGESCVPGASFFFGNPQLRGRTTAQDIFDERLVWVSPFFIDANEVTVERFRARWAEVQGRGAPEPVTKDKDVYCTWSSAPAGDDERRALNCVPWVTANAYCEVVGKQLPTEAQLELVMSGAGEEWSFPWGNDEPSCAGAVWGCAGIADAPADAIKRGADNCREDRRGVGPFAPGQGLADRVSANMLRSAGGEDVQDLGGNVAEWTRDVWARSTDPFWASLRPMIDPLNTTPNPSDGDAHAIRGGDWASTALVTRAGFRRQRSASDLSPLIGFRCARPAANLR